MQQILCSKCGKPLSFEACSVALSINEKVGYGSEYDGMTIEIDLCDDCLDKFIREWNGKYPILTGGL